MHDLIIGVVGVIVLTGVFVLLVRLPDRKPGACAGCALSGACERRRVAEASERGTTDRQTCYVGADDEDGETPV